MLDIIISAAITAFLLLIIMVILATFVPQFRMALKGLRVTANLKTFLMFWVVLTIAIIVLVLIGVLA